MKFASSAAMAPIGQMSPATAIAHGRCPCALINTNPYDQLDLRKPVTLGHPAKQISFLLT